MLTTPEQSRPRPASLAATLAELASACFREAPLTPQLRATLQEALRDGTFAKPTLLLRAAAPHDQLHP